MQIVQDANVTTPSGERVGKIDRVVIDPRTKEVTHVVVRKGAIFSEDKVVPIDLIESASEDGVALREDAGDLEDLPNFEEEHFVTLNEDEAARSRYGDYSAIPLYWYPPLYSAPFGAGRLGPTYPPLYPTEVERNIPKGTIALKEGARVISADGDHVGNVEQVLTEPEADRASHFVISSGFFLKEKKLVPVRWVDSIEEEKVHLAVGSSLIETLREYQE
jgi:uncharacterized protein YrrD